MTDVASDLAFDQPTKAGAVPRRDDPSTSAQKTPLYCNECFVRRCFVDEVATAWVRYPRKLLHPARLVVVPAVRILAAGVVRPTPLEGQVVLGVVDGLELALASLRNGCTADALSNGVRRATKRGPSPLARQAHPLVTNGAQVLGHETKRCHAMELSESSEALAI